MTGFITNSFTSAFNVYRDTLTINNLDLGVPVDNISITPNDSYINQNTQFGSIKVMWPHLSLSGDVQLFIRYINDTQLSLLERACNTQDTVIYIGFAGYMYRTDQIDYSYKPSDNNKGYDVTLNFYAVLPYSTPVFRPGFSTATDTNGLVMSSTIATSNLKGNYALWPLPGCTLASREDMVVLLTQIIGDNTVGYTISSDIKTYTQSGTGLAMNALAANTVQHPTKVTGLIKVTEGEDVYVSASYTGSVIKLSKYIFRWVNSVASCTASNLTDITTDYVTSMFFKGSKLYTWTYFSGIYKLISYDLLNNATASTIVDSSQIHTPVDGVTMFPNFTRAFNNSPVFYGFDDETFIAIGNNSTDIDTYNCYKLTKSDLTYVPGADVSALQGIHFASKLEDNRLIIFPKNLTLSNSEHVLYIVFNFRNYDEQKNMYSNPKLIGFKTGKPIASFNQIYVEAGYIQTNTAIQESNKLHMTTEAYADYYIENNIVALTLSTNQHKYYAIDLGATVEVRILTK